MLMELSAFGNQPCAGRNPWSCPSFQHTPKPGGVAHCGSQDRLFLCQQKEGLGVSSPWAGLWDRASLCFPGVPQSQISCFLLAGSAEACLCLLHPLP